MPMKIIVHCDCDLSELLWCKWFLHVSLSVVGSRNVFNVADTCLCL